MLGAGLEQHVLARQRLEQLDRRRAAGERGAARLVRERDGDGGVGVADERLDQVELGGRQVVEAVQQQRPPVPGLPQRRPTQRGRARRDRPRRAPPGAGGRRSTGRRARRRAAARSPPRAMRGPPRRTVRARRASAEAPRTGRRARPRSPGRRPRRRALATRTSLIAARTTLPRASLPSGRPPTPAVRAMSAIRRGNVVTSAPKTTPGAGELAGVVLGVGRRRDDEHRRARQRGAQALEHGARLGGVGRTGDQRQRHERLHRVARPDRLE